MRTARKIAWHDVAHALRERTTLLWVFLMPPIFFYFIGTVTGGTADAARRPGRLIYTVESGAGPLAERLAVRLEAVGFELLREVPAEPGRLPRLEVPAGWSAGLEGEGGGPDLLFVPGGAGPTAELAGVQVHRAYYTLLAEVMVLRSQEQPATPENLAALDAIPRTLRLEVEAAGKRRHIPSGFEQSIPGILVMFVLMVMLTTGAVLLVVERRQGLLRRLASAPVSRREIVLGKWGGRMALGIVQIVFALLAGTVLFGMDWGPHPAVVVLVLLLWTAFCASLALLLGSVGSTEGQVTGIGVFATMALAAFGGCWWPIEITPGWMQAFQKMLPSGWAMDALHRLISFGDGPSGVVPHLLALGLGALLVGFGAARRFRYE
jgi:hypothetical protein